MEKEQYSTICALVREYFISFNSCWGSFIHERSNFVYERTHYQDANAQCDSRFTSPNNEAEQRTPKNWDESTE